MAKKKIKADRALKYLLVLILLTHGYFFSGSNWNQNARYDSIYSFVEPGTPNTFSLRIDHFIFDPGQLQNTGDFSTFNGHYYSNKPPGTAIFGIPLYALLYFGEEILGLSPLKPSMIRINAYLLNLWLSVGFTLISVTALYRFLIRVRGWSEKDTFILCFTYSFGTLIFPFSATLWGTSTVAGLVLLAVIQCLLPSTSNALFAGILLGAATVTENMAVYYAVLGGCYFAFKGDWKKFFAYAAGGLPWAIFLLIYQKLLYGSYTTPGAAMAIPMYNDSKALFGGFSSFQWEAFWKVLVSPHRGIITMMPVIAFSFATLFRVGKEKRWGLLSLNLLSLMGPVLIISCYIWWHGGSTTGSRYLIYSLPLWGCLLPRFSSLSKAGRISYLALLVISCFHMLVITAVNPMLPPEVTNPFGPELYGRFFKGDFPQVQFPTHWTSYPSTEEINRAAFNFGKEFFGLSGLWSLFPLALVWMLAGIRMPSILKR